MKRRDKDLQTFLDHTRVRSSDTAVLRGTYSRFLTKVSADEELIAIASRNGDVLGATYERLLPAAYRRPHGQFFTPKWAAELMAAWILQEPRKFVLDPGVGSGALLLSVAEQNTRPQPAFLGIDTDHLAIKMASTNFAVRKIRKATFLKSDFLLDDMTTSRGRPDAIICNPPYGRHQALPLARKRRIHAAIKERTGTQLDARTSLPALFLARALEVAKEGARLAFITPSGWLDANSAEKVKSFLLEQAEVEAIIQLPDDHLFFDGVLTTSAITLIRKTRSSPSRKTVVRRLKTPLPSTSEVLRAIKQKQSHHSLVSFDATWRAHAKTNANGAVCAQLSDFAAVHRGIATGRNAFFVISEARRLEMGLRKSVLRACLASPKLFKGRSISPADLESLSKTERRWVLNCLDPAAEEEESALGQYLRWGRDELQAHESFLASHRSPWYAIEKRTSCPILFPYFNRGDPRFIRNRTDAVPLNNWLVVTPRPGIDADRLFGVLKSKEVRAKVFDRRRVYGRGLWKVEPGDLAMIDLGADVKRKLGISRPTE